MSDTPIHLAFEAGTLVLTGGTAALLDTLPGVEFDGRTGVHRAEGRAYRTLVEHLRAQQIAYKDEARAYDLTPWPLRTSRDPFPHQREALQAWWKGGGGRGVVVLPTGTGKTFVAILAIQHIGSVGAPASYESQKRIMPYRLLSHLVRPRDHTILRGGK